MTITVAILLIPISIMLAFAVDVGNALSQRQALSTSADSAALAVASAEQGIAMKTPNKTCAQLVSDDAALPAASPDKSSNIALTQINANSGYGAVLTASDITTTLSCTGSASGTLQVVVTDQKSVSTTFGKLAGVSNLNVNRSATAVMGVTYKTAGYRPIGVCQYQAQSIVAGAADAAAHGNPYPAQIIALSKIWGGTSSCGTGGSGNWGWLDCGSGVSASELKGELQNGCSSPIVNVGDTLSGAPGNKGSSTPVHDGMTTIMDTTVDLPVYDTFVDNGANTTFHVVGFLSVEICGYDVTTKGACYDSSVPVGTNEIQIRYAAYHPVGGKPSDGSCGVGQTCAYNSLSTSLVN